MNNERWEWHVKEYLRLTPEDDMGPRIVRNLQERIEELEAHIDYLADLGEVPPRDWRERPLERVES